RLGASYVDRDKADLNTLFKQGLEELRLALSDEAFCLDHLGSSPTDAVRAFQTHLQQLIERVGDKRPIQIRRTQHAEAQAREVAAAAQRALGLKPALVVMEFACGACSGLDEYTVYLTPGQCADPCASLRGDVVGMGIELGAVGPKLFVLQVLPNSPAELAGIKPGDRLLRIGQKATENLMSETAAEQLRGEAGSI